MARQSGTSARGSCCAVATRNSPLGSGLLDIYLVSYDGIANPVELHINMYDSEELFIPQGFTAAP